MRVKNISCNFFNKDLNIEFNDSSNHESNTYSLILGNNGSGKSTLFEAILSYYSKEYTRKDIKCKLNVEGKIKKVILSTYSPYDRIRAQVSRKRSRVFSELEVGIQREIFEGVEAEVIYPSHSFNEILSLASSSYFKCKMNNIAHFSKVEKEISKLIGFDNESIYLLIQSINQAKISHLYVQSRFVDDPILLELIKKRLKYSDLGADSITKNIEDIYDKKNKIISDLIMENQNDPLFATYRLKEYLEKILFSRFHDLKYNDELFYEEILSGYEKYLRTYSKNPNIEIEKIDEACLKFSHTAVELNRLRKSLLYNIDILAEKFQLNFSNIKKHLLKIDNKLSLQLFSILLSLKITYQNIQQQYGIEMNYEGKRRVLKISDLTEYYSKAFGYRAHEIINLDFDILEKTGNFLIDDLVVIKNNRPISISRLSSGELALFVRIMEISLYIEKDTLILIDEPETHLNPYWINQYYYLLKECFANLNCHFIIASQSPIVVGMFNKEQIFYLKSEDDSISVKVLEEETFVNNIDSILSFVFDVTYFNNPLVKKESADIKELSERDLFGALDRINQIAYSSVRNQIISEVLTEEKITQFEKLINEVDK